MKKSLLIYLSIVILCVFILASFSNVISIQNVTAQHQKKIKKKLQQHDFFQNITDFTDQSCLTAAMSSTLSVDDANPAFKIITNEPINRSTNISFLHKTDYFLTPKGIDTSVDEIVPYEQNEPPLNITVTGPSNLSNTTLYYRYSDVNFSNGYLTGISRDDTFRDGVDSNYMNYPNQCIVIDGIAYVVTCYDNALVIVDATNTSDLEEISHTTDGSYLNLPRDIAVTNDSKYCYIIDYTTHSHLTMWDISNKESPMRINQTTFTSEKGMSCILDNSNNYLYVCTQAEVRIVNITNKTSHQMNVMSTFHTGMSSRQIWLATPYKNTLYVSNYDVGYSGYGWFVYNISDKTAPLYVRTLNSSLLVNLGCPIYTQNGFDYFIFEARTHLSLFFIGYLVAWNISSDPNNPTFMWIRNAMTGNGNYSCGGIAMKDGYLFIANKNDNISGYNNGVDVWNITDIESKPTFMFRISGGGAPNYLKMEHELEFDRYGTVETIYGLSQDNDALTSMHLNWSIPLNGWVKYGIDSTYPWSFSFNFTNGTGYYKFFSIGQKSGFPAEDPPLTQDTIAHYTNLQLKANFIYTPENPTAFSKIHFTDTSTAINGTIMSWWWDFGDNYYSDLQNPEHCYCNDGTYNVTLTVTDNYSTANSAQKTISVNTPINNPPNQPSNPNPINDSTDVSVNADLNWMCSDPDGDPLVYDIYFGQSSSPPLVASNISETMFDTGVLMYNTLYYWKIVAWDNNGAYTEGAIWTFTTKASLPPVFGSPTPANGSTSQPVGLTWSIPINDPEGDQFSWTIQCSDGQSNSGTGASNGTKTLSLSGLAYGTTYTMWVNATDPAGSGVYTRNWYTFTTLSDIAPPITIIFFNGTIGENHWYMNPVTITFIATDNLSGVNYTMYKLDEDSWNIYTNPVIVSNDAEHTIKYYSIDNEGNIEDVKSSDFKIDQVPPMTTHSYSGEIGLNGWYISSGTFFLNAIDNTSGVNHTYYKIDSNTWTEYTAPVVLDADGTHTIEYYSVDNAGNEEPVKGPFTFKIDKTPPTITLKKEQIGFFEVKFTAEVNDVTSGIDRVEFSLDGVLQSNDTQSPYEWTWTGIGNHQVTATAFDMAGNSQSQSMSTPYELIQGILSIQFQFIQQILTQKLGKQLLL